MSLFSPLPNRPAAFTSLVKVFNEPQYLKTTSEDDTSTGLTAIDYEEQTAGYQAAYSRLAASESAPVDPVAYVKDPREFLGRALGKMDKPTLRTLVGRCDQGVVGPFLQGLVAEGYLAI
jgi:exportin-2 (importin alpha re-exporter)